MSTIPPIIQQLQQALPKLEIQHLPDIEGFMKSYYPQSYLEVMTPMEEMVGTVYSKSAFTDEGGNLIGLNLFDCDLTDEDLKALEGIDMSHLQTINLSKNQITRFDFSKDFRSIVVANLSENEQLKNVGIHRNCAQLARLEVFDAHLQRLYLPETLHRLFYVDVSKNAQLEEVVFAGGLNFLQVLLLRGTAIKEIEFPGSFPELVFLYLNNNQLEKLSIEQPMPKLRTLQLKENKFLDFSERCLHLGTKQIKNSEFWATFQSFFPRTEAIFFGGNPVQAAELATKLEDEKASNNIQTLEAHYKQRGGGTKEDDECKVILIGNGSAGKTSIRRRIIDQTFDPKWDSTQGIVIDDHPMNPYTLYFWDFGGQDIYHSTHRLFMQRDAVYILAWKKDTENNPQTPHPILQANGTEITRYYTNYKRSYWLEYARQLGKESPMLVVQTNIKKDEEINDKEEELTTRFQQDFPFVFEFHHVESDPDVDLQGTYVKLEKAIKRSVQHIKSRRNELATPLIKLRQAIRQRQINKEKRMTLDAYRELASELGVLDPMRELRTWLFRTGVVYFREGVFNNEIILDQTWAINAIYALFDRSDRRMDEIRHNRGVFTGQKLREIWHSYDPSVQEELLGFMIEADICYEIEIAESRPAFEDRKFAAPKLLPDTKPSYFNDLWEYEIQKASPAAEYIMLRYDFLHEQVMEGIITRTAYLADKAAYMWQYGTRISEDHTVIYVEQIQNELHIQVTAQGFSLLQKLLKLIEELQDETPLSYTSKDGFNFEPYEPSSPLLPSMLTQNTFPQEEEISDPSVLDPTHKGVKLPQTAFKEKEPQPIQKLPEEEIRKLVSEGLLQEATELLSSHLKTTEEKNHLAILQRRIATADQGEQLGLYDFKEVSKEMNRVAFSFLALMGGKVQDPDKPDLVEEIPIQEDLVKKGDTPPILEKPYKILVIEASPVDKARIRTTEEYRDLQMALRLGDFRDNYIFMEKLEAVTMSLFRKAIRKKPHIFHFSGHGEETGILLMGPEGESICLNDQNIEVYFGRLQGITQIVILNACHSSHQAQCISRYDMYVIGTWGEVEDDACRDFSRTFYETLGDQDELTRELILEAFEDACQEVVTVHGAGALQHELWYQGELLEI